MGGLGDFEHMYLDYVRRGKQDYKESYGPPWLS